LFSGPGNYKDGTDSTPIAIMKLILENNNYRNKFVTVFNDKNKDYISNLKSAINNLENIKSLKYEPIFLNLELDIKTSDVFDITSIIPSLIFIDPWGYKGVTQKLISSLTKDWGRDAILFFNYNRIRSGIENPKVEEHMKSLFGEKRYLNLCEEINKSDCLDKESLIMNEFREAMKEIGIEYILTFRFKNEGKEDTSHYIIFLSKNFTAHNIMKKVMASLSSEKIHGVAKFEYIPDKVRQLSLKDLYENPLEELKNELLTQYAGKTITFEELFYEHSKNKPFIKNNYKNVLIRLEEEGKILCDPDKSRRKKNTFSKKVVIKFLDK
jgi:three-Cys-motif partner protein